MHHIGYGILFVMRLLRILALLCFGLGVFAPQSNVWADDDKDKAAELIQEGDALLTKGDLWRRKKKPAKAKRFFLQSLARYEAAYNSYNSPKIYYAIAVAEQRLGRHVEATRHLHQLRKELEEPSEALLERVDEALSRSREFVALLELRVRPNGATIELDGELYGTSPLESELVVSPGTRTVAVRLEGYAPKEEPIEAVAGELTISDISLEKIVTEEPTSSETTPRSEDVRVARESNFKSPGAGPLWLRFGAAGIFLAGGALSASRALHNNDIRNDMERPSDTRDSASEKYQAYRNTSAALLAGFALFTASGFHYYFTTYQSSESASASALRVSPILGGNTTGIAVHSSF